MTGKTVAQADLGERALSELFLAIAAHDRSIVSRLVNKSPSLAARAIQVGATRAASKEFFLLPIGHYTYAGDTPLHIAAAANEPEICKLLVSHGANVSAANRRGAQPLHYAADGSPGSPTWNPTAQAAVIEILIQAGAQPDAIDKSGVAALHRAVRTRSTGAVRALLAAGANARLPNKSGSTPLHLAVQNTGRGGSGSAAAQAEQAEIIRLLLAHGARPSDKNAAGKSVRDSARADWIIQLLRMS
jgi:ankyrin repeat protein